jgi:hypothetical protein
VSVSLPRLKVDFMSLRGIPLRATVGIIYSQPSAGVSLDNNLGCLRTCGVIKIDNEPDLVAHKIIVACFASLKDALHRPAEIVRDIQQRLRSMILDVENMKRR